MSSSFQFDRLGTVCKQYGPGRLPKADRRDIGAGYAGASAALGITVLFALLMIGLGTSGVLSEGEGVVFAGAAIVSLLFVVPVAFLVGTVVTRLLPTDIPFSGAILGVVGTMGTYLGAFIALFVFGIAAAITSGGDGVMVEAAYFAATFGSVGFVLTCWLTFPVGCISGIIYERAGHPT